MRFGPWYPLAGAGDLAPAEPGVLQLRLARGLVDYPRGKSAMVWYAQVPDVRVAATALAIAHAGQDLVCRHLIEIEPGTDLARFCNKLRSDFVQRFGSLPLYERQDA